MILKKLCIWESFSWTQGFLGLFFIRLSFSVWLCLSRLSSAAKWVIKFLFLRNTQNQLKLGPEKSHQVAQNDGCNWSWEDGKLWGTSVRECCENRQQNVWFLLPAPLQWSQKSGKLQYIATELQLQAERAARRASIYKRHKQAKLFHTILQWVFVSSGFRISYQGEKGAITWSYRLIPWHLNPSS